MCMGNCIIKHHDVVGERSVRQNGSLSLSGVSSSQASFTPQNNQLATEFKNDFQQPGQALQSGNSTAAQQAYATLSQFLSQHPLPGGRTTRSPRRSTRSAARCSPATSPGRSRPSPRCNQQRRRKAVMAAAVSAAQGGRRCGWRRRLRRRGRRVLVIVDDRERDEHDIAEWRDDHGYHLRERNDTDDDELRSAVDLFLP
jgi:hypothetical protein